MRFSRPSRSMVLGSLLVAVSVALASGNASAQSDSGQLEARGLLSVRFAQGYQNGDLDVGGNLDDTSGIEVGAGFSLGDYFSFQLGYEGQYDDDYDTHYFPATFIGYSPAVFERVRFYGTAGIGLFFARTHDSLNANDNERASGFHAGGGLEIAITEQLALLWYAKYMQGLGSADDYESVVQGIGLQFSWGL